MRITHALGQALFRFRINAILILEVEPDGVIKLAILGVRHGGKDREEVPSHRDQAPRLLRNPWKDEFVLVCGRLSTQITQRFQNGEIWHTGTGES